METVVIALGGNAILKKGEKPNLKTQEKNVKKALKAILPVIKNKKTVITHGNGPQVGLLLLKQNAPLDVLDAETGGQIGYLIQQNLHNLLRNREVVTLITQVLVDRKDPGFRNLKKFIGPFYKKKIKGIKMKKDPRGGYRKVVASPKPIKIIENKAIKKLLENSSVVIAAGGGGIPVVLKKGNLDGAEAVIDKDLASACLANSIKSDELIMITDIDRVYMNYKKKEQKPIKRASLKQIREYQKEGHFGEGSMGPKIQAAIDFLSKRGKKVIITNTNNLQKSMKGKGGTVITR